MPEVVLMDEPAVDEAELSLAFRAWQAHVWDAFVKVRDAWVALANNPEFVEKVREVHEAYRLANGESSSYNYAAAKLDLQQFTGEAR